MIFVISPEGKTAASLATEISAHEDVLRAEMRNISEGVAKEAARQAVEEVLERMGLGNAEDMRAAIRLARAWEAAQSRFYGAIATGVAFALLAALWAGYQTYVGSAR